MAGQVAESYAYAEADDDPAFAPLPDLKIRKRWIVAGVVALFAMRR